MGESLLMVRNEYRLLRKLITARNSQANAIIECCHQCIRHFTIWYELTSYTPKLRTKLTTKLLPVSSTQYVEQ